MRVARWARTPQRRSRLRSPRVPGRRPRTPSQRASPSPGHTHAGTYRRHRPALGAAVQQAQGQMASPPCLSRKAPLPDGQNLGFQIH